MNVPKPLVIDANILIRAIFGTQVCGLLEAYEELATFYSPDVCVEDARKYIQRISIKRSLDAATGLSLLDQIARIVEVVDRSLYEEFEAIARARIASRDPDDWPIVATALLLDAPIWTEDRDFFGAGVATWTSDRIELYLKR